MLFHGDEKTNQNSQKRTKNGYCINPPQAIHNELLEIDSSCMLMSNV